VEAHRNLALAALRQAGDGQLRGAYQGMIDLFSICVNVTGDVFGEDDLRDLHAALAVVNRLSQGWAKIERSGRPDITHLVRSKEVQLLARALMVALAQVDVDELLAEGDKFRQLHYDTRESQDRAEEERVRQRRLSEFHAEAMRTSPADIIRGAETNGVTLSVDSRGNVISHPFGQLNDKSREMIKLRRAEIAALLAERARVEAII
jgi:hypothetical protein